MTFQRKGREKKMGCRIMSGNIRNASLLFSPFSFSFFCFFSFIFPFPFFPFAKGRAKRHYPGLKGSINPIPPLPVAASCYRQDAPLCMEWQYTADCTLSDHIVYQLRCRIKENIITRLKCRIWNEFIRSIETVQA